MFCYILYWCKRSLYDACADDINKVFGKCSYDTNQKEQYACCIWRSDVGLKREVIAAKTGRHGQQTVVIGRNLSLAVVWSTLRWTASCACACACVCVCVCVCMCEIVFTLYLCPDASISLTKKLFVLHISHQWRNPRDRDLRTATLEAPTFYDRCAQIFHTFWSHLKILSSGSKLHTEDKHILGVTVQNLFAMVAWCPVFVHPSFTELEDWFEALIDTRRQCLIRAKWIQFAACSTVSVT